MNRKEAQKLLSKHFSSRWGKGDHLLFYSGSQLVYGLAVSCRSNSKDLPSSEVKKILRVVDNNQEKNPWHITAIATTNLLLALAKSGSPAKVGASTIRPIKCWAGKYTASMVRTFPTGCILGLSTCCQAVGSASLPRDLENSLTLPSVAPIGSVDSSFGN